MSCIFPTKMFFLHLCDTNIPTILDFSRFILDIHPTIKGNHVFGMVLTARRTVQKFFRQHAGCGKTTLRMRQCQA